MQCFWFINELAESYERQGNYAMALKYFHKVDKIFVDVYDDQFDFHSYSIRKCVLRAYVDMIEFEDKLQSHPYFKRAAKGIVRINLKLAQLDIDSIDYALEALNLSELQPIKVRVKKEVEKPKEGVENDGEVEREVDLDPHGLKYLKFNKSGEALKFAGVLTLFCPKDVEGWVMSCESLIANRNIIFSYLID